MSTHRPYQTRLKQKVGVPYACACNVYFICNINFKKSLETTEITGYGTSSTATPTTGHNTPTYSSCNMQITTHHCMAPQLGQ